MSIEVSSISIIYRYDEDLLQSKAEALVNTVNCVGVMGKGIALQFKNHYPEMYKDYYKKSKNNKINIGKLFLFRTMDKLIINFPTKKHWRNNSEIQYIIDGLNYFRENYKIWKIKSIAFPQLGCGNGNLKWVDVKKIMEEFLQPLDIEIEIFVNRKREILKKIEVLYPRLDYDELKMLYHYVNNEILLKKSYNKAKGNVTSNDTNPSPHNEKNESLIPIKNHKFIHIFTYSKNYTDKLLKMYKDYPIIYNENFIPEELESLIVKKKKQRIKQDLTIIISNRIPTQISDFLDKPYCYNILITVNVEDLPNKERNKYQKYIQAIKTIGFRINKEYSYSTNSFVNEFAYNTVLPKSY